MRKLSHLFVIFAILYGSSLVWYFCSSSFAQQSASFFAQQHDPRIVGGEPVTDSSKYPWVAALVDSSKQEISYGQFCGGTLITPEWVVTAAHCVCDSPDNVDSPDTMNVVLGTVDLKGTPNSYERLEVSRIIVNPNYDSYWTDNDVALLKLKTASSKSPIDFLATSATDPIVDNTIMATVMGWGDTEAQKTSYPSQLYEVDLPLVSNQECASLFGEGEITDNMICAGFVEGGKDACFGDSGGPLVIPYSKGGYNLIGIVSWGYGCAQPNTYGVYTNVSKMREWILSQTSSSTFTAHIQGKVTASDGTTPLEGIKVIAYSKNGDYWSRAADGYTDLNGNYDIKELSAGNHQVKFIDESNKYLTQYYNNQSSSDMANDIILNEGEILTNINASLVLNISLFVLTDSTPTAIESGSYAQVYGCAGINNITVKSGAFAKLINFPGINIITIQAVSSMVLVSRSGATVTFKDEKNKTTVIIPATKNTQLISFNNMTAILKIEGGKVMFGSQEVTTIETNLK